VNKYLSTTKIITKKRSRGAGEIINRLRKRSDGVLILNCCGVRKSYLGIMSCSTFQDEVFLNADNCLSSWKLNMRT